MLLFVIIIGRFKVFPGVTQDSIRLQNLAYPKKYLTISGPHYCVKEIVSNNRVAYSNNCSCYYYVFCTG